MHAHGKINTVQQTMSHINTPQGCSLVQTFIVIKVNSYSIFLHEHKYNINSKMHDMFLSLLSLNQSIKLITQANDCLQAGLSSSTSNSKVNLV